MALRRIFSRWLWPAAFVLPVWLLLGWGVFGAGGWAFLWVLFIAVPSVFVVQTITTLLVRARPSFRRTRAVSWWDVAGFTVWHALTIAVGCFIESWFGLLLALAVLAAAGLVWIQVWQLWREASPARLLRDAQEDADRTLRDDRLRPDASGGAARIVIVEESLRREG